MKKYFFSILLSSVISIHSTLSRAEDILPSQCTDLIVPYHTDVAPSRPLVTTLCSVEGDELRCQSGWNPPFSKEGQLNNLLESGQEAFYQNNYPTALQHFGQGLCLSIRGKDKEWRYVGQFFNAIGLVYDALGEYEEAIDCCEKALTIERQGAYLMSLGTLYKNMGNYEQSSRYYEDALMFYRQDKDRQGEADMLANIGALSLQRGEYQKALTYLNQANTIQQLKKPDKSLANTHSNRGLVYRHLGLYQKALECSQESLKINEKIADKRGQGAEYTHIGNVYLDIGVLRDASDHKICKDSASCWQQALEHYQKALLFYCETGAKAAVSINLNNIGDTYKNLRDYSKAIRYFQFAKQLSEEMGDKLGIGIVLNNLGETYRDLQKYDEAKKSFQESIEILATLHSDSLWQVQANLASVEERLNRPENAIDCYGQALDTIDELRGHIEDKEYKTSFIQNKLFVYDDFIALLQEEHQKHPALGYDKKAFETFERKQGRVFLEQIGKSGARRFKGLSESDMQTEKELEERVAVARKNLDESYEKVLKEQRDFEENICKKDQTYCNLKYPKPVTLVNLQQTVLQADEAMLVYNVRQEATDLWFISQRHFQMFSLPLTEAQIKAQVDEFRNYGINLNRVEMKTDMAIRNSLRNDFAKFTEVSYALYQQLFPQSVRELLGQAKPKLLYIVPTADLYELPFEALITHNADKPHYLIEDYAISYLSSASLLKTLRDAKAKSKSSRIQQKTRQPLLAFADPVYPPCPNTTVTKDVETTDSSAELQTKGIMVVPGNCFPLLPSTGEEARAIAKLLNVDEKSQPAPLQLKEAAAKSTVLQLNNKQQLVDYQYILFSTHAILPNEISFIQQPAIVLLHTQPTDENGFLTMKDIFGLTMNADLVMLAACNTGRGEKIKGEGTIGLTRAFMYAGTPAVSITLWSVESKATKKLNIHWFTQLQEQRPVADSLRAAKLNLLDSENYYRYPYAWAGIVMFGDGK